MGMEGSARRTCNGRERGRGQGYDEPVNRLSSEESERFRPMTERGDAGPDEVGDVRSFDDFVFEKRLRAGFGGESSAGERRRAVRSRANHGRSQRDRYSPDARLPGRRGRATPRPPRRAAAPPEGRA